MSSSRRSAATRPALTVVVAVVIAACGNVPPTGSPVSPGPSAGPSATTDAVGTPGGPSTTPATSTPGVVASTSVEPPASVAPSASPAPGGDPQAAAAALDDLGSYHVSMSGLSGQGRFTAELVVIRRPTPAREARITVGGTTTIRIIRIGGAGWIDRTGAGTFVREAPALLDGTMGAFQPATLISMFAGADLVAVGSETRNGVVSTHYHADAAGDAGAAAGSFPPGATVDVWISDSGYLVAFEAKGFPSDAGPAGLRIDVTRPNDPGNRVTKPA